MLQCYRICIEFPHAACIWKVKSVTQGLVGSHVNETFPIKQPWSQSLLLLDLEPSKHLHLLLLLCPNACTEHKTTTSMNSAVAEAVSVGSGFLPDLMQETFGGGGSVPWGRHQPGVLGLLGLGPGCVPVARSPAVGQRGCAALSSVL